jgi:hypothetical protein
MFISFSINVLTFHTILTPLEEFKARYFSIASKSKQINNIVCKSRSGKILCNNYCERISGKSRGVTLYDGKISVSYNY